MGVCQLYVLCCVSKGQRIVGATKHFLAQRGSHGPLVVQVAWLHVGDHNMNFFHACATMRHNQNRIIMFKNVARVVFKIKQQFHVKVHNFYIGLYTALEKTFMQFCIMCVQKLLKK